MRLQGELSLHVSDLARELNMPAEQLIAPAFARHETDRLRQIVDRYKLSADGQVVSASIEDVRLADKKHNLRLRLIYQLPRRPAWLALECRPFPASRSHQVLLTLTEGQRLSHRVLTWEEPAFFWSTTLGEGRWLIARRLASAGFGHLAPHLLFLVGLLLLGGSCRWQMVIVGSLLAGEGVGQLLLHGEVLTFSPDFVGAAVALSVIYIAADNLLAREGWDARPLAGLGFGVLHGFDLARGADEVLLSQLSPAAARLWFSLGALGLQLALALAVGLVLARYEPLRGARAGSLLLLAAGLWLFCARTF